jgi:hypothetical protein
MKNETSLRASTCNQTNEQMKKILFLMCLTLCLSVLNQADVSAQPPQGGRQGGMGRGAMRPPSDAANYSGSNELVLDYFPDIPGLSLEQRVDIIMILLKEQKSINGEPQKRLQLAEKKENSVLNDKEQRNVQKKIDRLDQKIQQKMDKSNKKIKKILSEEQYRVFIEKRAEFRFRHEQPQIQLKREPNAPPEGGVPPSGRPPAGGGRRF